MATAVIQSCCRGYRDSNYRPPDLSCRRAPSSSPEAREAREEMRSLCLQERRSASCKKVRLLRRTISVPVETRFPELHSQPSTESEAPPLWSPCDSPAPKYETNTNYGEMKRSPPIGARPRLLQRRRGIHCPT
ncbi:hypothetical protein EYF80_056658 [Liparis tanakae]|uniref:Uncharacterized protein n=1 Tax=Liparis tanakae TaxID=230148 RepID=A0A4Z2EWI5_9TELE|nr:hypothetical protein EYF80_056658 [Liparis tanakae]